MGAAVSGRRITQESTLEALLKKQLLPYTVSLRLSFGKYCQVATLQCAYTYRLTVGNYTCVSILKLPKIDHFD